MLFISIAVYNLFIWLYEKVAYLLSFQDQKAARWYLGRKDIFKKIAEAVAGDEHKTERIWMHCASLGEFEQGRPLLEALRKEKPDALIFLTFFSPSGYEVRKKYPNADHVFYLPTDTRNNARRFLQLVRPTLAIGVKYEFWYHYFNETRKMGIRFILISAIFRKEQVFFKWYGRLYRKMLACLTEIFVQDETSVILLKKWGFNNVIRINDTRVDRVANISANARNLPTLEMFLSGSKALVAGSAYETENEIIHQAFTNNLISDKIIIVPHHVDSDYIEKIKAAWGDNAAIYSTFNEKEDAGKKVLIVDTVGLLSNIYQYASVAVIGGGFGKGIHNTLEPAAFGLPILFGPKYQKFVEAVDMVGMEAAFTFSDTEEFQKILIRLRDDNFRKQAGEKTGAYIKNHIGGTEVVLNYLRSGY